MIRIRHAGWTVLALIPLLACAHKGAPLVKDRLKPRLSRIASINERQVLLTFSEEIDTTKIGDAALKITASADTSETLAVITAYPALSASELMIVTGKQEAKKYRASGLITDRGDNIGTFSKTFDGSARPDTIRPWLKGYARGHRNSEFRMQFAKAMDTTSSSALGFRVLPKKNLVPSWSGFRQLSLTPVSELDSLRYDTTYYCYCTGLTDISGNDMPPFIISITPDTLYKPYLLKGRAVQNDTAAGNGLVLLKRTIPLALTQIVKGEFTFEVRDSSDFTAIVVADGWLGEATVSLAGSNTITLRPEKCDIDTLFD